MPEDAKDRPFVLMAHLVIADQRGDYEKAAESQRKLRDLGWFVSRKPPDEPRPTRHKKSATTSTRYSPRG